MLSTETTTTTSQHKHVLLTAAAASNDNCMALLQLVAPTKTVVNMGNASVPIQLAQCWFPGLAIFNAKIEI